MKFTSEFVKEMNRLAKEMEGDYACRMILAYRSLKCKEGLKVEMTKDQIEEFILEKVADVGENQEIKGYMELSKDRYVLDIYDYYWKKKGGKKSKYLASAYLYPNGEIKIDGRWSDRIEGLLDYKVIGIVSAEEIKLKEREKAKNTFNATETKVELAELKGSEKQISWALTIRYEKLGKIYSIVENIKKSMELERTHIKNFSFLERILKKVLENVERLEHLELAGTWIDYRIYSEYDLVFVNVDYSDMKHIEKLKDYLMLKGSGNIEKIHR